MITAPEVIHKKEYANASDIYSIGMLMWEVSSGQPPFTNFENDYDLVIRINHGMRPKIIPGTPLEYESIMTQCWDADPLKRPNINTLHEMVMSLSKSNILNNYSYGKRSQRYDLSQFAYLRPNSESSLNTHTTSRLFTSRIYQFENLPEPKNATEVEQEEFHSRPYDFSISSDFVRYDNTSKSNTSKSSINVRSSILRVDKGLNYILFLTIKMNI
ncbi:kinase-like domain-containing protein [Rhizophagus diaphanus]|nr:kinase-like domain-containing protein [Rhizophagus diaphanus] [Rhizophagus sp. MUCL 43196]